MHNWTYLDKSLRDLLDGLPQLPSGTDFGEDIEQANKVLLSDAAYEDKRAALFHWIGRRQPCLFGRLAAHQDKGPAASKGLGATLCWIDEEDIDAGAEHVSAKIQSARRAWKDVAEQGLSSAFLIMFNSARLAYAAPGEELLRACLALSELYLVEHIPIAPDAIYTEAIPLRRPDGALTMFRAGCNIFYSGAHGTRNHDRRVPGGLMFSMNSVGHYANTLVMKGMAGSLEEAVDFVRATAWRSVGNGGIGHPTLPSASWHNRRSCPLDEGIASKIPRHLPSYIPKDFDPLRYSATYHTDVLVPTEVTVDGRRLEDSYGDAEVWSNLMLDYFTPEVFPPGHVNYGMFHGHPVDDNSKYHNPWGSLRAHNSEDFVY